MDMFKWYALNDNVMGGVSNGNVTKNDANNLSFWGKLSSENRGGFASCRTDIETGVLSGYTGLSFMVITSNLIKNIVFFRRLVGIIENTLPW